MTLKIEILQAPLRPMIPHRSPSATVKVMFLRSSVAPKEMPTLETESRVTRRWQKAGRRRQGNLNACFLLLPLIRKSGRRRSRGGGGGHCAGTHGIEHVAHRLDHE